MRVTAKVAHRVRRANEKATALWYMMPVCHAYCTTLLSGLLAHACLKKSVKKRCGAEQIGAERLTRGRELPRGTHQPARKTEPLVIGKEIKWCCSFFHSFWIYRLLSDNLFSFLFSPTGLNKKRSDGSPSRLVSARLRPLLRVQSTCTIQNKRGYRVIISCPYLQSTHKVASSIAPTLTKTLALSPYMAKRLQKVWAYILQGRSFPRQQKYERATSGAQKAPSRYQLFQKKKTLATFSTTAISRPEEKTAEGRPLSCLPTKRGPHTNAKKVRYDITRKSAANDT